MKNFFMFKLTEQRKSMIPVAVKTAKIGVPECPCLSWVCAVIPFIVARYDEHGGCGVSEHGVTSLDALGIQVDMREVDGVLKQTFNALFGA